MSNTERIVARDFANQKWPLKTIPHYHFLVNIKTKRT